MNPNASIIREAGAHVDDAGQIVPWQQFWIRLLREYEHVVRELDAATPDPLPPEPE